CKGLTVAKVTGLRSKLRAAGVEYRVVKNTLLKLAAKEAGIVGLDPYLEGQTAIIMSKDLVAPAKTLAEWIKLNKIMEIKGGILQGKVLTAAQVYHLAELPSREVLLGRVVGSMMAPLSKFAFIVDAIRKQKEEQAQ
ncbi:MAG: 50S ribosomal protein L10, partial [bacterium]|nr:50S ribosomal protein L10 [bacterium]